MVISYTLGITKGTIMNTVKTAISINPATYRKITRIARKLHISRSRFFSQAAEYMIAKDENLDLLRRINASCSEGGADATSVAGGKRYFRQRIAERW